MAARGMFWRIVRRLLTANYPRLFVILLALAAGAAVTAALLNLQMDAKRRLTAEFRALGANVIVAPRDAGNAAESATLSEELFAQLPSEYLGKRVPSEAFLYVIGEVAKAGTEKFAPAVLAGISGQSITEIRPGRRSQYDATREKDANACEIGAKVAAQFGAHVGDTLVMRNQGREASCTVFAVVATTLARRIPVADVHGIKQLAETEGRLYNRISGLLSGTVLLVLLLTSLCVMAGMSNIAIERKNDVGLMKAIGGSVRRVVELFLAEAALMGIAGGTAGAAIGMLSSVWLGKAVFGVAAEPRWIVYPLSVALTVIVSIASALPLRRLAGIRPASVFRGEA